MAAKNGHEAIMQFLVDHGANVNHRKEEVSIVVLMIRVCCSVLSLSHDRMDKLLFMYAVTMDETISSETCV